jgi:hypothetical protein
MKEFAVNPLEWAKMSRFDRKVLLYSRVMEEYYTGQERKRQEKKAEAQKNREKFAASLPKVKGR